MERGCICLKNNCSETMIRNSLAPIGTAALLPHEGFEETIDGMYAIQ